MAEVAAVQQDAPASPIRLRWVVIVALLGWAAYAAYPRLVATWRLHDAAAAFANYGLCMAGPTGPAKLRDNPTEFKALVRRRLISARVDDRPFERCAKHVRDISGSIEVERAHRAQAGEFREYGVSPRASVSIGALNVSNSSLRELADAAWPFVRDGWTRLVRPSSTAYEAPHPVSTPRSARGSGLPGWRPRYRSTAKLSDGSFVLAMGQGANLSAFHSRDGGVTWASISPTRRAVTSISERCIAPDSGRSFMFGLSDDGRSHTASYLGPDGAPLTVLLAPVPKAIVAAACDNDALVVALRTAEKRTELMACLYRKACRTMPMPKLGGPLEVSHFPVDIARVGGVTVMAINTSGVVRVTSTRNFGETWLPFTVAYDSGGLRRAGPTRLLSVGDRILLHGTMSRGLKSYPVLASDDFGASWRTP